MAVKGEGGRRGEIRVQTTLRKSESRYRALLGVGNGLNGDDERGISTERSKGHKRSRPTKRLVSCVACACGLLCLESQKIRAKHCAL